MYRNVCHPKFLSIPSSCALGQNNGDHCFAAAGICLPLARPENAEIERFNDQQSKAQFSFPNAEPKIRASEIPRTTVDSLSESCSDPCCEPGSTHERGLKLQPAIF